MAKKYLKKITDALSGVDSDMPVIRSTPDQLPAKFKEGGPKKYTQSWGHEGTDPSYHPFTSSSIGERMRDESRAFYNSDKGKNSSEFVTMNGDKARNPDKKAGSGFGVKIDNGTPTKTPKQIADFISEHARGNHMAKMDDFGAGLKVKDPDWVEHPNQKAHHTKMAMDGNADKIGDHVPNKKFYQDMAKNHMANKKPDNYVSVIDQLKGKTPFNAKEYYKGGNMSIKPTKLGGKSPFSLTDDDHIIGAATGTGVALGEGISYAMDQSHESGKKAGQSQSDAHSYWTRKKNGQ